MKQLVIVVAMVLACGVAFAAQTGTTLWHNHSYTDTDTNTCDYADRYSEYQLKQKMPLGIGVDVVLYEPTGYVRNNLYVESVNVESKWDMANKKADVYVVTHINLWEAIQNIGK